MNDNTNPLQSFSQELASLITAAEGSVLRVEGARRPASATLWDASHAVVPTHVLGRKDEGYLGLPSGGRTKAKVLGRDAGTDLALLHLPDLAQDAPDLQPPTWAETDELSVGHLVVTLARPGPEVRATMGMVSGVGGPWATRLGAPVSSLIDVDGDLPRGFAGGPLIDTQGRILGLNTHALLRGGTTVPTATVRRVVAQLLEHGEVRPGWMGVAVQPGELPAALASSLGRKAGVLITNLVDDGPAKKGGLLVGDLVVAVDDAPTAGVHDLLASLAGKVGTEVKVQVARGGELTEVSVAVEPRPEGAKGRRGRGHGHRGHGDRHHRHRRRGGWRRSG